MKDRKMHLNNFFANVFCFFMVHQKKNIKRNTLKDDISFM